MDAIYERIQQQQKQDGKTVDLLIICGDFQVGLFDVVIMRFCGGKACRNLADLECLACPRKYRDLKDFHAYYEGTKVAPLPTIFIGGNHEASNHLWELYHPRFNERILTGKRYHGGWVAPNIYFLGWAGVLRFGQLRIAGLSGIYKKYDYYSGLILIVGLDNINLTEIGHHEKHFNDDECKSIYHVRHYEVFKLSLVESISFPQPICVKN